MKSKYVDDSKESFIKWVKDNYVLSNRKKKKKAWTIQWSLVSEEFQKIISHDLELLKKGQRPSLCPDVAVFVVWAAKHQRSKEVDKVKR